MLKMKNTHIQNRPKSNRQTSLMLKMKHAHIQNRPKSKKQTSLKFKMKHTQCTKTTQKQKTNLFDAEPVGQISGVGQGSGQANHTHFLGGVG